MLSVLNTFRIAKMLALPHFKLRGRQPRILSSPAPCELRVCEKWEVGEKLKRSHSPLCYGPTVAQVMGSREPLVEYKTCYCDTALGLGPENPWKYPPHVDSRQRQDTRNVTREGGIRHQTWRTHAVRGTGSCCCLLCRSRKTWNKCHSSVLTQIDLLHNASLL